MIYTEAFIKILNMTKPLRIIAGGTRASKTYSVTQQMILLCLYNESLTIDVFAPTIPELKRGALHDFLEIMNEANLYNDSSFNKTDRIFTFPTGSKMRFSAVDDFGKAKQGSRDISFFNECNHHKWEIVGQIMQRTRMYNVFDFNPDHKFWIYSEIMENDKWDRDLLDWEFLTLTHKDNHMCPQATINYLESRKYNQQGEISDFYKVYGLGQLGRFEGQVFEHWDVVDEIPKEARLLGYGLDFGFANDPHACIAVYTYNKELYLNELIYQTGMDINQLINQLKLLRITSNIVYDSSAPMYGEMMRKNGIGCEPCEAKAKSSINFGVDLMKTYQIHVHKKSTNVIKEFESYRYKEGGIAEIKNGQHDHAIDAARYLCVNRLHKPFSWSL